ncbi:hypothetical protein MCAMS1_01297 [biofilm metagenome]
MNQNHETVRVLYSFPHRLGADRICYTAWQQVNGLASAGADLSVFPSSVKRAVPANIKINPTLAWWKFRIPYKLIGSRRAFTLHDFIVSRRIEKLADKIDIIHTWSQGSLLTLKTAERLGIPTVLERPNAHTRFAYEIVQKECDRLGIKLPPDHEHAFNEEILKIEEAEFDRADYLLCPSDFVVKTYIDRGFAKSRLRRHIYGYDEKTYFPDSGSKESEHKFTMLFVGVCAVRKGLHYALEAWLDSPAKEDGQFLIAGEFLPAYQQILAPMLAHPSVHVLGHRTDVPQLMRKSDILVLPSIEEGFGLVCTEAMGSGCVPLVSDACTDLCRHMDNSLVHHAGDVNAIKQHITTLYQDRRLLQTLRTNGLNFAPEITWGAAGIKLLKVYRDVISEYRNK